MRLDHATKYVFVVPGIILALLLRGSQVHLAVWSFVAGALVAALIASANYVINEWLDRDLDALHPTKSARTAVQIRLEGSLVWVQWLILVVLGLVIAALVEQDDAGCGDRLRRAGHRLQRQAITGQRLPLRRCSHRVGQQPATVDDRVGDGRPVDTASSEHNLGLLAGGAFLMGAKRLSEYREIVSSHGRELLVRYRASFAGYDETNLASSCLIYALLSAMSLAIFFVKYRIEYVFVLPAIAVLFGKYLALSMQPASTAQKPERLFRESGLMMIVALIVALFAIFSVVNIPMLEPLMSQQFIELN